MTSVSNGSRRVGRFAASLYSKAASCVNVRSRGVRPKGASSRVEGQVLERAGHSIARHTTTPPPARPEPTRAMNGRAHRTRASSHRGARLANCARSHGRDTSKGWSRSIIRGLALRPEAIEGSDDRHELFGVMAETRNADSTRYPVWAQVPACS